MNKEKKHILIVDDEVVILSTLENILENLGYKVSTGSNGQEAVNVYEENYQDIDLIIMDMMMPKMNGKEAIINMRKINPSCQVIMTSGFIKDADLNEVISMGLIEFIRKPYRLLELNQVIEKCFDSKVGHLV